jgi:hypothetical protein
MPKAMALWNVLPTYDIYYCFEESCLLTNTAHYWR